MSEPNAPPFVPGARIGRYRLLSVIGKGGMGEVFRAEDTALARIVAVKILPAEFVSTPERTLRFEQEARLTASLAHPNVVPVFDVGEVAGVPYVVQEFVDGETMEDFLDRGPVAPGLAVAWCKQAADGLAAAHETGILHRDIKPGNLILGRDGRLRVLDFGLATLDPARASADPRSHPGLTTDGLVLGTPHYMSPEQATGKKLDARSDVFSLGVVLYELLSAQRPFEGESTVDILHAIIHSPPRPLDTLDPPLPPGLLAILQRALRKKPDERYASMRVMAADLEQLLVEGGLPGAPPARSGASRPAMSPDAMEAKTLFMQASRKGRLAWVVAGAAVLAAAVAALVVSRSAGERRPPAGSARPEQVTSSTGLDVFPCFTPDGGSLVYSSDQSGKFEIYRRPLAPGGKEIALTSDGLENLQPAVSPDGSTVAYHSKRRGGIWLIPSTGGTPRRLADFGSRPAFSPDGKLVAFETDPLIDLSASAFGALPPSVLWLVPASGGTPVPLTEAGRPSGGHGAPSFSPDGQWVVFSVYSRDQADIWAISLKTRALSPLAVGKGWRLDPVWDRDGKGVLYCGVSDAYIGGLYRLQVDPASGKPAGRESELQNFGTWRVKQLAISPDGRRLAYVTMQMSSNLWSLAVDPVSGVPKAKPVALTRESGRNSRPVFSPDGARIAYSKWRLGATQDVWTASADGSDPVQRTTDPADDDFPAWLPGGTGLAFVSRRLGHLALFGHDLSTGRETLLADPGPNVDFIRVSPDGRRYSYHSARGGRTFNVFAGEIGGPPARQITFDAEMAGFACWSPDGAKLAIEVKRGEHVQVGLVPSAGGPVEVLTAEPGQSWPYGFSPDGDRITFAGMRDGLWNVYWVSASTRKIVKLSANEKINAYVRYPEWSPMGDRIVYEYAETTGNVWSLTGFR